MVSKCANPGCNAPFLYFHQGKLFRRERAARSSAGNRNGSAKSARYVEFYWLCGDCAETMTLTFREDAISVVPRIMVHTNAA